MRRCCKALLRRPAPRRWRSWLCVPRPCPPPDVWRRSDPRLAVSDAGCAAAILRGALEAAALNVLVNTKTMTDRPAADHLNARCFALLDQGRTDGERIFCAVRDQLV